MNCGSCLYFTSQAGVPGNGGVCRFSPPTPMIVGMQQTPALVGLPGGGGVQPVLGSHFPPVRADQWCGCYRARPAEVDPDA